MKREEENLMKASMTSGMKNEEIEAKKRNR
jgi:hypothetical protein